MRGRPIAWLYWMVWAVIFGLVAVIMAIIDAMESRHRERQIADFLERGGIRYGEQAQRENRP